ARYKDYRETVLILLEKGADPNYRNAKGRTALHACLLSIKEAWPWYKDDDMKRDMSVITALLEAGTSPADKDDDGDTPLATALRIAGMDRKMAPIGKLVRQYADAEDIKIAAASARKEKKEDTREMLSEYLPPTITALAFPLILGGLSFIMRSMVFKDNPSDNIMGPVNGILTLGGAGFFLGFLMGGSAGDGLGAIGTGFVGGLIGGAAGIIVACLPPVRKAFTDNQILYYTPAALSAVTASVIIFNIWF
ncbi:MAG: ankyrin repeat domain-containing protein, partial [Treponema sp.]|nr:ankyrin repeat domain-containing protein [Treponema sp.]